MCFLTVPDARSPWSRCWQVFLPGSWTATFSLVLICFFLFVLTGGERVLSGISFSYQDTNSIRKVEGGPLGPHLTLITSLKAQYPNILMLVVRASIDEFSIFKSAKLILNLLKFISLSFVFSWRDNHLYLSYSVSQIGYKIFLLSSFSVLLFSRVWGKFLILQGSSSYLDLIPCVFFFFWEGQRLGKYTFPPHKSNYSKNP